VSSNDAGTSPVRRNSRSVGDCCGMFGWISDVTAASACAAGSFEPLCLLYVAPSLYYFADTLFLWA
jgi:hypothetical protein